MSDKVKSESTINLPSATRIEFLFATLACLLFPFWFITLGNINIGPGDVLIGVAGVSYFFRNKRFPFGPDALSATGLVVFLGLAGGSILWTSLPLEGLKQYLQLLLIFMVVVPSLFVVYVRPDRRWKLAVILCLLFVLVTGSTILDILLTSPQLTKYGFIWGQQNTYSWALTAGVILTGFIAIENSLPPILRCIFAITAVMAAILAILSVTLSSFIGLGFGGWIFGYSILNRYGSRRTIHRYVAISILGALVAGGLVVTNWSTIYNEGALYSRIPMYVEAAEQGLARFPLGHGLGSSPTALADLPAHIPRSTHNFVLHYWLTTGIGVFGFLVVLAGWGVKVLIPAFAANTTWHPYEQAFPTVFAAYLAIAFFQPPPIRRFWWVFFGVSWAIAWSKS